MSDMVTRDGELSEKESLRIELLLREACSQRESLRLLDGSLHQLAFAYIAAFALCVPAVLAVNDAVAEISPHALGLISFVLCTIFYFGGFYALMLIRSRNLCCARIGLIEDMVNAVLKQAFGPGALIPYEYSSRGLPIYYGAANGLVWFLAYAIFLLVVIAGCGFTVFINFGVYPILAIVSTVEIAFTVVSYSVYFSISGSKKLRSRLEREYTDCL